MKEYNPFGIVTSVLKADEGTLEFTLERGNLFNPNVDRVLIFMFKVEDTLFSLYREGKFKLNFMRERGGKILKKTEVDLSPLGEEEEFIVTLLWSREKDILIVEGKSGKRLKGVSN